MEQDTLPLEPIRPAEVRYIKLGPGNAWFAGCQAANTIEFGHKDVAHELALTGDVEAIAAFYRDQGKVGSKPKDLAREVVAFYTLGADCLWVTFAEGALWWAFAAPEVQWLGEGRHDGGERRRKLITPWRNTDIHGNLLAFSRLSSRLTTVAAYQQTICQVKAKAYLLRRINGEVEPLVAAAQEAQGRLEEIATKIIGQLHWRDFEVLVDLIFARSGWQRVGEIGGAQKDTDLVLEQTVTSERAFVQVKSAADAAVLADYVKRFRADPAFARMFFVCHSPRGRLDDPGDDRIHVWTGNRIAHMAIAAGLTDWLLEMAA